MNSPPRIGAVIDIGTNSVKLLVAKVCPPEIVALREENRQTRLGENFYDTGRLNRTAIQRTAASVREFAEVAQQFKAATIRVIATSAAREASNAAELLEAVRQAAGLSVEIISGQQEAKWAFEAVLARADLRQHPALAIDLGGGSAELILGQSGQMFFSHSYPLGTVRLLELLRPADPPTADDWRRCQSAISALIRDQIRPALAAFEKEMPLAQTRLIAAGGAATTLGALALALPKFQPERLEGLRLARAELAQWRARLWSLPLAARRALPGLPPPRADVILVGAAIFELLVQDLGFDRLQISTRGLRHGVLLENQSSQSSRASAGQ